jgi:hypothetical protein
MHCHRNSNVRHRKFYLQLAAVVITICFSFLILHVQKVMADQSEKLSNKEKRIETYISTAFNANNALSKFKASPRVNIICPESQCIETAVNIKNILPKEAFVQTSSALFGEQEILIFLGKQADIKFNEIVNHSKSVLQTAEVVRDWGETGCLVHQTLVGYEIKSLTISIQSPEDEFDATTCAMIELVRGSGGQSHSSFSEYNRALKLLTPLQYDEYKTGANYFLRLQWSSYLPPGITKKLTHKFLTEHLN